MELEEKVPAAAAMIVNGTAATEAPAPFSADTAVSVKDESLVDVVEPTHWLKPAAVMENGTAANDAPCAASDAIALIWNGTAAIEAPVPVKFAAAAMLKLPDTIVWPTHVLTQAAAIENGLAAILAPLPDRTAVAWMLNEVAAIEAPTHVLVEAAAIENSALGSGAAGTKRAKLKYLTRLCWKLMAASTQRRP